MVHQRYGFFKNDLNRSPVKHKNCVPFLVKYRKIVTEVVTNLLVNHGRFVSKSKVVLGPYRI